MCVCTVLRAAEVKDEQAQIAILQSNASPQQKDAACARLKRIGTRQSVSALAALLADEQLSHSARYALESMAMPEAGSALAEALGKTAGLTKAGILNSLGNRREAPAVPALVKALADPDAAVNSAAAVALGKIGGPEALRALKASLPGPNATAHAAIVDGLLLCANGLLAAGDRAGAGAVFQQLYESKEKDSVRVAAYAGMIRSAGDRALALVTAGIAGQDSTSQTAALQMARDIQDPAATKALADLLPKSSLAVQIALTGVLSQRGDPAAAPALVPFAKGTDPAVRLPAITALGVLSDASVVPLLANASVAADEAGQKAARQALLDLRRGNVTEALIAQLMSAQPAVQAEVARALAGRADKSAVPRLLELAKSSADAPRKAALRALGMLTDGPHLTSIVQLLIDAKDETARSEVADSLSAICERLQVRHALDAAPILDGLARAGAEARAALLPVCSVLVDARARTALRAAVANADPRSRVVAIRALCDSRDPELMPDILAIARGSADENLRLLPIRGYVRLATDPENAKLTSSQRAELLKQVLPLARRPEEKRAALAGLATVPDPEALKLVMPFLDDGEVRAEAVLAAVQIAGGIRLSHVEPASVALKKVLAVATDPAQRETAQKLLQEIEAFADYITSWQVAGPYFQNGKDSVALFDIAFPPEAAEAKGVTWRALPSGTDPKQPWLLDLLKFLGGDQRVAYVRTQIHSETDQPVRLFLGTDDGVKVWLNGKLVHANNATRGIARDSDKVNVALKQGWNTLLLKITQNVLGWEFCARFVKADGTRLEGLRFDASPAVGASR